MTRKSDWLTVSVQNCFDDKICPNPKYPKIRICSWITKDTLMPQPKISQDQDLLLDHKGYTSPQSALCYVVCPPRLVCMQQNVTAWNLSIYFFRIVQSWVFILVSLHIAPQKCRTVRNSSFRPSPANESPGLKQNRFPAQWMLVAGLPFHCRCFHVIAS